MLLSMLVCAVLLPIPCHSELLTDDPPGSYPLESYLGLTTFPEVAMAPGAKRLAFVASRDDFDKDRADKAVWRLELQGKDGKPQVGKPVRITWTPGGYSSLQWSPDGRRLAFLAARAPTGVPQLFVVAVRGGQPTAVSFHPKGVTAFDWGPDGETLYFACPELREGDQEDSSSRVIRLPGPPESFALFRRDLNTEEKPRKLATVPHTVADIAVSPDGARLAYLDVATHEPLVFVNGLEDHEVYLLATDRAPDGAPAVPRRLTTNFLLEMDLAWTADGTALFGLATGDPDSAEAHFTPQRVVRIDVATGEAQVLAQGFAGAFKEATVLPNAGKDMILATANVSTHTNLYSLSTAAGDAKATRRAPSKLYQRSTLRGTVTRPTAARGSSRVAFVLSSAKDFPEIYLAEDLDSLDDAVPVTRFNRELARLRPPELETVRWTSDAGTEVEGVVYWPPGLRGAGPLPLVVDLHGGPWGARNEELVFNGNVNFAYFPSLLASRGFLVLAPNYRGGTGRGDAFFAAVNGFSCSRPASDVLAGVDFLVTSGWADPDRLAVIGYSYGGLVTNCLLGRTDRFRAAVSGAGIWNDVSYFGTADNFMQTDVRYGGAAPWEDFEMYWRESAMSGAGSITTPTLITHGGSDRRVPSAQAFELYRALRRRGVRAELLIFPDEGHIFRKPSHKLEKVRAEVAWLEEYLTPPAATPAAVPSDALEAAIAGAAPEP